MTSSSLFNVGQLPVATRKYTCVITLDPVRQFIMMMYLHNAKVNDKRIKKLLNETKYYYQKFTGKEYIPPD